MNHFVCKNGVLFVFTSLFFSPILSIAKNQPALFNDEVDTSEWDFVVKFWSVALEDLFRGTTLRLKWGDNTHLTVHETASNLLLKVDLRIILDQVRHGHNREIDVGVLEAAKANPGDVKYIGDRCKTMIQSKAIIDRFILDGCCIGKIDSLQVCGPKFILETSYLLHLGCT